MTEKELTRRIEQCVQKMGYSGNDSDYLDGATFAHLREALLVNFGDLVMEPIKAEGGSDANQETKKDVDPVTSSGAPGDSQEGVGEAQAD